MRVSYEVETEQNRALAARRAARDDDAVRASLAALVVAARSEANMVPPMIEAARVEATLGEICGALREVWGDYREPARF
jgi:methylmalonyl-CoA mutase N-terminal domain/subunit